MLASILTSQREAQKKSEDGTLERGHVELVREVEHLVLRDSFKSEVVPVIAGTLASILAGFPPNLKFEREIEEEPIFIDKLPNELLVMVLRKLDAGSVERFARVCRKARLLALDPVLWMFVISMLK